ncbi:MAG TPA: YggS family pyridoxal phosphate-dependent enzyme [Syntrophomonadaceae bacterium]|nr:YggS family pyridoxal phosphate-dependent enzyme [Syntrophomonadaceae bacterium]
MNEALNNRINDVYRRIAEACQRVGRQKADVKLVAVSKGINAEQLKEAISTGLSVFGENRVQDFLKKYDVIDKQVEWHFIGHLQRNKARYLAGKVSMIHSLDSMSLAATLNRLSDIQGYAWQVLVQVNVSGEATKFGLAPSELPDFLDEIREMKGLKVCGLMTIAPYCEDPEEVRPVFRRLRELKEDMMQKKPWLDLRHLSMGMSNDFEVAVEEGATLVRIGSALFGS